jgi:hypothetical protein
MRGIDATTVSALNSDHFQWASLVTFNFNTPLYLTTWSHEISALGHTFTPSNHIISLGDAKESADLSVGKKSIVLDGADQTFIAQFLNNDYINVGYTQHVAIIDNAQVQGLPFEVYDGLISGVQIEDSGTKSTVKVEIASHWADFEKKAGRKSNSGSQKIYFPNDLAFDFKFPRESKWGKK